MGGTARLHCRQPQQEGPLNTAGLDDGIILVPLCFWRLPLLGFIVFLHVSVVLFAWVCVALCVCASLDAFIQLVMFSSDHLPKQLARTVGSHASVQLYCRRVRGGPPPAIPGHTPVGGAHVRHGERGSGLAARR